MIKKKIKMKWPKNKIRTLDNSQPHKDYGGWKNFLKTCEIRDQYRGVIYFGRVNCNYILFPDGILVCNYGFHGVALMNEIRDDGVCAVKKKIIDIHKEIEEALIKLKNT